MNQNEQMLREALQGLYDAMECHDQTLEETLALFAAEQTLAAVPAPSERRHVGDSMFETWFSHYNPDGKGDKQRARDAYAAGMGESEPAPLLRLSDEDIVRITEAVFDGEIPARTPQWANALQAAMIAKNGGKV